MKPSNVNLLKPTITPISNNFSHVRFQLSSSSPVSTWMLLWNMLPEDPSHYKCKCGDDVPHGSCESCWGEFHPGIVQVLVYYGPDFKDKAQITSKHVIQKKNGINDMYWRYGFNSSNASNMILVKTEVVIFGHVFLPILFESVYWLALSIYQNLNFKNKKSS